MTRGSLVTAAAALLLMGCGQRGHAPIRGDTPGDRLEAAALAAGVVVDPARADPAGLYARGDDRLCVVPGEGGAGGAGYRVGVLVRYDDQGCAARGTAARSGDRLTIDLAPSGDAGTDAPCRIVARFEGDRIVFPADVPAGCDRACTGRASLAAFGVDRTSDDVAEASRQRDSQGRPLCRT